MSLLLGLVEIRRRKFSLPWYFLSRFLAVTRDMAGELTATECLFVFKPSVDVANRRLGCPMRAQLSST